MSIWTDLFGGADTQFQEDVDASIRRMDRLIKRLEKEEKEKVSAILDKIESKVQIEKEERDFLIQTADCKSIMRLLLMGVYHEV
jgi:hypothetical protein